MLAFIRNVSFIEEWARISRVFSIPLCCVLGDASFITLMSICECTKGVFILTFPYDIYICYTYYNSKLCTYMEDL